MKNLGRLMTVIFPWPSRHQRREAIGRARTQKEASRLTATRAATIEADIEQIRRDNHLAAAIAEQLMRGRAGGAP